MSQQGDVLLFQTNDDGDIIVENGLVSMSPGFETAAYLSMFGGNEDDNGLQQSTNQWWGNLGELEPSKKYRSETQNLIQSLPATVSNLLRLKAAATRDLDWFLSENIASLVDVQITIPNFNRVNIVVRIEAQGVDTSFEFTENWKATRI